MITSNDQRNIENFFNNQININYKKFKEENSHLKPNFYFLLLATRIDNVKTLLDTPQNSTKSIRTSKRKKY